jgi:hypothetical protein
MSIPQWGLNTPNQGGPLPLQHHHDSGGPEDAPCTRCGHRALSHAHSGTCSVRGRWWRRCPCSGYTGFDSAAAT